MEARELGGKRVWFGELVECKDSVIVARRACRGDSLIPVCEWRIVGELNCTTIVDCAVGFGGVREFDDGSITRVIEKDDNNAVGADVSRKIGVHEPAGIDVRVENNHGKLCHIESTTVFTASRVAQLFENTCRLVDEELLAADARRVRGHIWSGAFFGANRFRDRQEHTGHDPALLVWFIEVFVHRIHEREMRHRNLKPMVLFIGIWKRKGRITRAEKGDEQNEEERDSCSHGRDDRFGTPVKEVVGKLDKCQCVCVCVCS